MATLFDVICEQHEKKEAFKNKIVEKRLYQANNSPARKSIAT